MKKNTLTAFVAATTAALCLVAVQGMAKPGHPGPKPKPEHHDKREEIGKQIAPVTLNLEHKKKKRVYLGSYLVNAVGGCNDCHTAPAMVGGNGADDPGQPNAANYLAGGAHFGPFVSANITPDENGRPAGLTRDEFIALIRTGYDADEDRYLGVMPWPVYRHMTDGDLRAIYEYLTAIPHAEPAGE